MAVNTYTVKVYIVVNLLALIKGALAECDRNSVIVRGRCYEKEVLVENLDNVQNLVVDFHTNVLYFNTKPYSRDSSSYYLDLNTWELGVIAQVADGRAQAVDQVRHEVYIAGRDGIYKFHYNNKTVEYIGINKIDIRSMFYKDQLYCTASFKGVNIFSNGEFTKLPDTKYVDFVAVDEDGYQFFGRKGRLFGKTKNSSNLYVETDKLYISSMATDVTGNPYFCYGNQIYSINKDNKTLKIIGFMTSPCLHLAFDKDNNIICASYNYIAKLKLKAAN